MPVFRQAILQPLPHLHYFKSGEESNVVIADRLRALPEEKKLSQGGVEKRSGLLRCYISRVEKGRTVPAIETLEKLGRATEAPMYRLFYDGELPAAPPSLLKRRRAEETASGDAGKGRRVLDRFRSLPRHADEEDLQLLLHMARKMARGRNRVKS